MQARSRTCAARTESGRIGRTFPLPSPRPGGTLCAVQLRGVAANEAENDTKSFFVNVNYDINETTQFFARGNVRLQRELRPLRGRRLYQLSPFPGHQPGQSEQPDEPGATSSETGRSSSASPYRWTIRDLPDGTVVVQGPFDLSLFYRNVPGGFRDTNIEDTLVDYMVGVNGTVDFLGGMDWELAGQWSQQTSNSASPGLASGARSGRAIHRKRGPRHVFAVNGPDGCKLSSRLSSFDGIYDGENPHHVSMDGNVSWDLLQAACRSDADRDRFRSTATRTSQQNYDAQSERKPGPGLLGWRRTSTGARTVKSIFTEVNIPIISSLDATRRAALRRLQRLRHDAHTSDPHGLPAPRQPAVAAEPCPASLENSPRFTPRLKA